MKTILQRIHWKNWNANPTLLMLCLAASTLTGVLDSPGKPLPPPPPVVLDAASVYPPEFVPTDSELTHIVPGYSPGYAKLDGITWDWGTVKVDLSNFASGYYLGRIDRVDIRYGKNAAGQIISVKVEGVESIPGARDARFHDTPWLLVRNGPVTINTVNGYTLRVRADNIPVFRHKSWRSSSAVEGVVDYMSLGDLVLTLRP